MGILRKFASIAHSDEFGYAYDSEAWERDTRTTGVESKFRMFQTYGHDLIQHSSDWSVTPEHLTDYLYSLTAELLREMEDRDDFLRSVGYEMNRGPNKDVIEFAAGVIYKESDKDWNKRRYFSVSEMKISNKREKEYDKRYQEVRESDDGTPEAVYRMILPEYVDGFTRMQYAQAVRDWFFDDKNTRGRKTSCSMELPGAFLKWFGDGRQGDRWERARKLRSAFETCKAVIDSWHAKRVAESGLEDYRCDLARERKKSEQPAETEPVEAA